MDRTEGDKTFREMGKGSWGKETIETLVGEDPKRTGEGVVKKRVEE